MAFKVPYQSYPALPQSQGGLHIARNFAEVEKHLRFTGGGRHACRAFCNSAYTQPATTALIQLNAVTWDESNAFNTTTFLYTAPEAGLYDARGAFIANSNEVDDTFQSSALLRINGVTVAQTDFMTSRGDYTETDAYGLDVADLLNLAAGDTVGLLLTTSAGTMPDFSATSLQNYLSIYRTGPRP